MSVVLQDEASGASTGGTIYLTNIHRLYEKTEEAHKERRNIRLDGAHGLKV